MREIPGLGSPEAVTINQAFGDCMNRRRILLVEDEADIADLLAIHLQDVCDQLIVARDGYRGMGLAMSSIWSLIILDLRIPGPGGLEICRTVRRDRPYQPILILTSKSSEVDRVLGLESGADDYVTKPFSILELVARVRAVFRRVESLQTTTDGTDEAMDAFKVGD
ncbi:MAG: response regulator, partial [Chromatiaceae bacterium]